MYKPEISIIMPVYNRDFNNYLHLAITSALNQTYSNFELIIVNDGSTDKTSDILLSFKDERIKIFDLKENKGEYWVTNYAVNKCSGNYLTWLHSDDLLPKNSLELRFDILNKNHEYDFVHGNLIKIDANGDIIEHLDSVNWNKEKVVSEYLKYPTDREKRWIIHHQTIMMKWKFFYTAGPFDASLPYAGDMDWLYRAIIRGNYLYLPESLYKYRIHDQARSITDIENGVDRDKNREEIARRYR